MTLLPEFIVSDINITAARYSPSGSNIIITNNGDEEFVPQEVGNRLYDALMELVDAGTITITAADPSEMDGGS